MSIIQNLAKLATKVSSSGTISYADLGNKPEVLKVTSISYPGDDLAADPAGGQTITLTGSGFATGAQVLIDTTPASVVTVVSSTSITFTAPAKSAGTYVLYVVNTDGSVALSLPGISYSGTPAWSTSAGTLGTQYETTAVSKSLVATGDGTITYSLLSGTLPPGSTLNTSTGAITGTAPVVAGSTTYNFTIRATDAQKQDTDRAFSITVSPDVVTWSSPVDNYSVSADVGVATTVALAASAATGNNITYSANTLPAGMTLSGNNITGTPTTEQSVTSTITATSATTNRSATRTVTWTIVISADTYFKYVTLLVSGNGTNGAQNNTFIDSSSNNFTITRNGNTTQGSFSPYGSNWSTYFGDGGANTALSCPSSVLSAGGDVTLECWIYPLTTSVVGLFDGTPVTTGGLRNYPANTIAKQAGEGTGAVFTVTANKWQHFAAIYSTTAGGTIKVYIDGTLNAQGSFGGGYTCNRFDIGTINGGGDGKFAGYISNFRVTTGIVYTGNFTPSTAPLVAITGTTLLTCNANRFKDSSTANLTVSVQAGSPSVQRFSPFPPSSAYTTSIYGGSGQFNGTGDYLSVPDNAAFNFGTGNFTIEFWVYPKSLSAASFIWDKTTGNGNDVGWWVEIATGIVYVGYGTMTTTQWAAFDATALKDNSWTHIALQREGSAVSCFVNGVQLTNKTLTNGQLSHDNAIAPRIGSWSYGSTWDFNGYLCDLRIVKGSLVYSTSFTPPTAPLTVISGTSLLLGFTNAAIYDNAMIGDIQTAGNTQISTSTKKYGTGAIYNPATVVGSGVKCNVGPSGIISSDYTLEWWAYHDNINTAINHVMIGPWTANQYLVRIDNGTNLQIYIAGVQRLSITVAASGILATTWQHYAITRAGTNCYFFVDGVQRGTWTQTGIIDLSTLAIAAESPGASAIADQLNGYMDDIRLTKRYARYTANFTPPTTALQVR